MLQRLCWRKGKETILAGRKNWGSCKLLCEN